MFLQAKTVFIFSDIAGFLVVATEVINLVRRLASLVTPIGWLRPGIGIGRRVAAPVRAGQERARVL